MRGAEEKICPIMAAGLLGKVDGLMQRSSACCMRKKCQWWIAIPTSDRCEIVEGCAVELGLQTNRDGFLPPL
jgi:hypothetical protein